MTVKLAGKIERRLQTWIEELLPEHHDTDGGAQPLNLEELQNSLRPPNERDARKLRRSRAA